MNHPCEFDEEDNAPSWAVGVVVALLLGLIALCAVLVYLAHGGTLPL